MDTEQRQFRRERPPCRRCLPLGGIRRHDDIAEQSRVFLGEGEHVGGGIDPAIAEVEVVQEGVAGDKDAQLGIRRQIKDAGRFP